jgi:hypothetical protein
VDLAGAWGYKKWAMLSEHKSFLLENLHSCMSLQCLESTRTALDTLYSAMALMNNLAIVNCVSQILNLLVPFSARAVSEQCNYLNISFATCSILLFLFPKKLRLH